MKQLQRHPVQAVLVIIFLYVSSVIVMGMAFSHWLMSGPAALVIQKNCHNIEISPEVVNMPTGLTKLVVEGGQGGNVIKSERVALNISLATEQSSTVQPFEHNDVTVVTAYFSFPSKHSSSKYLEWMANMLSLSDNMVIYTSHDLVEYIQAQRAHAKNRTVVHGMNITELPLLTNYNTAFWENQLLKDPERAIHQSFQVFWIWLSKSWFVIDSITRNHFQSGIFMWTDIGCFRDTEYNNKTLVLHKDLIPTNSMLHMAFKEVDPPKYIWWNNKYLHGDKFYHVGGQLAGNINVWKQWYQEFTITINGFVERNMFIGDDQMVAESMCLRVRGLCLYVQSNQVKGDPWFGLGSFLHYGGNCTYWSPPHDLPADPQEDKERSTYQV